MQGSWKEPKSLVSADFAYLRSFSMKKHPQPAKVWAIMIIDSDVIICYYIKVLKRMKWYFDDTRKEVNNEKIYF